MSMSPTVPPVILILTGNLGDGHRQAAYALAEEAVRLFPGAKTPVVDIMERTHPRSHVFSRWLYLQWITRFPGLYGFLYRRTKEETRLSRLLKRMRLVPLAPLLELLHDVKPTVVVSTFPSAAAAMSQLKERRLTQVPTVTVLTDHTWHSYWFHPGTDRYIVASERVRLAMSRWAIPDWSIKSSGIPIRSAFGRMEAPEQLREQLGLDPTLPAVLIMGGGCGLIGGDWGRLLQAEELRARPMQLLIICGRNTKLQQRLRRELADYPHPVHVLGYVDNVHELMGAADLLVTKPGGLTTAEALASRLPMLLYKPLPGQEYDNAEYLTGYGAALQAHDDGEFVGTLSRLLDEPRLLAEMQSRAGELSPAFTARQAVLHIAESGCNGAEEKLPLVRARIVRI